MSAGGSKKRGFGDIVAVWALETRNVLGSDHLSLPSQDSGGAAGQGEEEEEDKEHKVDKVDRREPGRNADKFVEPSLPRGREGNAARGDQTCAKYKYNNKLLEIQQHKYKYSVTNGSCFLIGQFCVLG